MTPAELELSPSLARLLHALEHAERRGLTRAELQRCAGRWYRLRLRELEDAGAVLRYVKGRFRRRSEWWRVVLILPPPPPGSNRAKVTTAAKLFDAPPKPPISALTDDVA